MRVTRRERLEPGESRNGAARDADGPPPWGHSRRKRSRCIVGPKDCGTLGQDANVAVARNFTHCFEDFDALRRRDTLALHLGIDRSHFLAFRRQSCMPPRRARGN